MGGTRQALLLAGNTRDVPLVGTWAPQQDHPHPAHLPGQAHSCWFTDLICSENYRTYLQWHSLWLNLLFSSFTPISSRSIPSYLLTRIFPPHHPAVGETGVLQLSKSPTLPPSPRLPPAPHLFYTGKKKSKCQERCWQSNRQLFILSGCEIPIISCPNNTLNILSI